MQGFKGLVVWQKAKDLAVRIYKRSNDGGLGKDFAMRDQIRRSAVSVPSNLAEGDERDTDKESIRFFFIAKGSLAELRTQLEIAWEVGYLSREVFHSLDDECEALGKMIGALIKARRAKSV